MIPKNPKTATQLNEISVSIKKGGKTPWKSKRYLKLWPTAPGSLVQHNNNYYKSKL